MTIMMMIMMFIRQGDEFVVVVVVAVIVQICPPLPSAMDANPTKLSSCCLFFLPSRLERLRKCSSKHNPKCERVKSFFNIEESRRLLTEISGC